MSGQMGGAFPRLEQVLIPADATMGDAMKAIDAGAVGIALVVDADKRLLGTVSDGDARRALLSGASLETKAAEYMTTRPRTVGSGVGRAEVLDLMQALSLDQIPVIDESGVLLGLHVIHELLGAVERSNWAVIMAGGQGRRLAPLTEEIPKPMLPVAGRPILERLVLHLVGYGVRRIFISINHLGEVIEEHFGDGSAHGCSIEYLREERPLGTGGSLRLLLDHGAPPDEPVLVMNGDLVTQFSVGDLLRSHADSEAMATVVAAEHDHQVPFGVLTEEDSWLTSFEEKPVFTWPIAAGIYVLEPVLLERIPPGVEFGLPDLLVECLDRGERVHVWRTHRDWSDVGSPTDLLRARGIT